MVGGGASGCLVATQLLRLAQAPLRVVVVEGSPHLGRGIAYRATRHAYHLLNVPAGRMSAFADDPSHFLHWLNRRQPAARFGPSDFVERSLYGWYLRETLAEATRRARRDVELAIVADEATRLELEGDGVVLHFRQSTPLVARAAVLAIGNSLPSQPLLAAGLRRDRWRADPWVPEALEGIPPHGRILLLGSGLTMVDVALALADRGHRGRLVALSRRGLLPRAHSREAARWPAAVPAGHLPDSARGWLRFVRTRAAADGWRDAVDGLRPVTQQAWRTLSIAEKRRFLRHLQPYWDVHRHRMAPEVARRVDALLAANRLSVFAGRLQSLREAADGLDATWVPRGAAATAALPGLAAVVNCTGPSFLRSASENPLLRDLVSRSLARLDALGLGLDASADGVVVSPTGEGFGRLFTLGPPLMGVLWETTAIPEIRVQAEQLARRVLAFSCEASGLAP